jgi:hypothetical protein
MTANSVKFPSTQVLSDGCTDSHSHQHAQAVAVRQRLLYQRERALQHKLTEVRGVVTAASRAVTRRVSLSCGPHVHPVGSLAVSSCVRLCARRCVRVSPGDCT